MGSFDCSFDASFDVDPACGGPSPSDGGCCRGFDCLTRDPLVHWCL